MKRDDAIKNYAHQATKRRDRFNQNLTKKDIGEGSIVLRYDNKFDNRKDGKFFPHWEGPFKLMQKFDNGSFQLMDINGKVHNTRINGWRIRPYFPRIFEVNEMVELEA